jgi:hypothetical protein
MNPDCVYIGAPKEVMLTNKDFHECSYYDKSIQFCNYRVIVDTNQPRVIQLWTGSGNWHMLAEKVPFATKCYENSSIEAGFVRIVKNEITLAWVKRHFGYAILKETEEELQEMWKDMLGEDRRVTRPYFKKSRHYIDFEKIEEEREEKWDEENVASANKRFKKNIELFWNPGDRLIGYYYYKKEDKIYLLREWEESSDETCLAEGFSTNSTSTGCHSKSDIKKYKKLTRTKFLEKFLDINEHGRLKEIEAEKRRKEWKEKESN